MAILTPLQYDALWHHNPIGMGSFAIITGAHLPCYHAYLQREIYFQDYLDLYIGVPTFNRVAIGGLFYVQITGNPILGGLGIPPHPALILAHGGNEYLLVDYDYPWMAELANANNRCIKYTLIAEACPNEGINYFYNLNAIVGQGYLNAAYNATYNGLGPAIPWAPLHNPADKLNKLLDLASRGVLLVDIFPFAIHYNINVHYPHLGHMLPLRDVLNNTGITNSFLNNAANMYSVTNRVTEIIVEGLTCVDFMNGTNSVLIAPTKISYHLAHQINTIPLVTAPLIFTIGENSLRLMPPHIILELPHNYFYHLIPAGTTFGGFPLPLKGGGLHTIKVPRYICCAYSGAGTVPHALFITNALL